MLLAGLIAYVTVIIVIAVRVGQYLDRADSLDKPASDEETQ